ncbi:aminotransferase class V-fold PLP-dependent enzyme [Glaciibacter superstes]|uniref:aminotransferase class V-fold PLP-dependent enzyme n=1 Tax=Glaciibacter superstes TaxID=501023 RepID=UPI0003B56115|nr:aminotransferase class V-fold PLP-dependent enzyme [Glaciibacter superstes]
MATSSLLSDSTFLSTSVSTIADATTEFAAGRGYLSACTLGLPTRGTVAAITADTATWAAGQASAAGYGATAERARAAYAGIVGVDVDRVAIGSQTSVMAGMIASSVPDGAEVLCVDGDFSSIVFPFLAQSHRGVTVRHVPLHALAENITGSTWLVAFSLVQSATGAIAEADDIVSAARTHGTHTFCDTTQAVGWLPVDASRFDATACHAYKWLCSPRGAAFLTVSEDFAPLLRPVQAGWYAGDDPWGSCYGPAMNLATDARRFDVSPAWQAWVGAAAALDFFAQLDIVAVREHNVGLGNALSDGLGLDRRNQAIVTWPDVDGSAFARISAAGIIASSRAGRARAAFHLWNDEEDVDLLLAALRR